MANVSVIVPAAGAATRFGASQNKIFAPLGDRPLFLVTLDAFAGRDDVGQIQLVVSADDLERMRREFGRELADAGAALVVGGPTRSQSVRNALAHLSPEATLVCVHDAVRPCVADEWIDAVFAAAAECGAAVLACPVRDTLKRVADGDVIAETVCRKHLWEAQTPQVFHTDLLRRAYAAGIDATDDAELVQALNHAVRVVAADRRNVKITTPADLAIARSVLPSLRGE